MKPRSLLVRDRSQIGTFSHATLLVASHHQTVATASGTASVSTPSFSALSVASSSTSSWSAKTSSYAREHSDQSTIESTKPTEHEQFAAGASSYHDDLKGYQRTTTKTTTRRRATKWVLEFITSLIGGSIGAYMVLFLGGERHHQFLVLCILIPLVLAELWEFYCLASASSSSSSSTTTTHAATPPPTPATTKQIKKLQKTKKRMQLRYGQGLFMSAGLAKVLSLTDPLELFQQIPTWCTAWAVWTFLFGSTSSSSGSSSSSSSSSNTASSSTKMNVAAVPSPTTTTSTAADSIYNNYSTTTTRSKSKRKTNSPRSKTNNSNRKLPPRSLTA